MKSIKFTKFLGGLVMLSLVGSAQAGVTADDQDCSKQSVLSTDPSGSPLFGTPNTVTPDKTPVSQEIQPAAGKVKKKK